MLNHEVDIIIPCYNMSRYLAQAIESALAQTYRPLKVIVVDDGSTEDICSLVKSYGSCVEYIRQENRGQAAARNNGIRQTRGEYICFLDADDVILPTKTVNQINFLNSHPDVDLVFGCTLLFSEEKFNFPYADFRPFIQWDDYLDPLSVMCPFPIHSALLRRRMINRFGFFSEELRGSCEDWAFWLQCVLRGARFAYAPEVTSLYRKHSESTSTDIRRLAFNEFSWIPQLVEKFKEADQLNEHRRKMISCGVRFVAARLLAINEKSKFDNLVSLAQSIQYSDLSCSEEIGFWLRKKECSQLILYLLLTKEYIDIGFPQIASFCLLHVGDFRLLRDEAITYGLGGLFDKVIQEITKYVSPSGISMNRDLSLRSTSVAKLSKVASRFCDSFQPRIPEGATHASYLIHQLGLLDQENGKIDEAVTKFERAINENPYYWAYYEDLLRLLCLEGRKNEVEQVVISLHKLDAYAKCWLYFVAKEFIRYLKVIDGMRYLLRSLTSYPVSTLRFIFKDIKYILERFLP